MKVLLRRNVPHLGKIGDVVEVKPGYARNYLVPHRLAVEPTQGNLKAIEAEKLAYLQQLAHERAEVEAKAAIIQGREITIVARANEEGHLYGSIGPAQVSAVLAEGGAFIDAQFIKLDEPIQQLDKYDVKVDFGEEISATIHVWVVPIYEGDEDQDAPPSDKPPAEAPAGPPSDDEA